MLLGPEMGSGDRSPTAQMGDGGPRGRFKDGVMAFRDIPEALVPLSSSRFQPSLRVELWGGLQDDASSNLARSKDSYHFPPRLDEMVISCDSSALLAREVPHRVWLQ